MRLRTILFGAMILVSIVPVIFLAFWQQQQSLNHEIDSVKEKHLLVAKNLTAALDRYIKDVHLVFSTVVNHTTSQNTFGNFSSLLTNMGFRHIYSVTPNGKIIALKCAIDCPALTNFPHVQFDALAPLRSHAIANPNQIFQSNLIRNVLGEPSIYILMALSNGELFIGELSTQYPVTLQKSITFGEGGHAAIVDKTGRLIAHPLANWVREMKDISKLPIVQQMMRGESGVTQFFSPAVKADMVAGFNVSQLPGWGVMVPQPFQELVDNSNRLRLAVVGIAILGVSVAALLSWWISGILARPLQNISNTIFRVASGDMTQRVSEVEGLHLYETNQLTKAFNDMLEKIHASNLEIQAASKQALEANKVKSEFLANMSHELRTPLNAIIGFSDMIKHQKLGPVHNKSYLEYAADIHHSGQHLLDLINDILDISVLEQDRFILNFEALDIQKLIENCLKTTRALTDEKNIKIQTKVIKGLPQIHADKRALKQIILNILGNASKFTPPDGHINIEITHQDKNHILIFKDTGSGISEDILDRVTEPFVRSNNNPYTSHQGTGLGLAIVNSLVKLHGGDIDFQSTLDVGTVITITLPTQQKT